MKTRVVLTASLIAIVMLGTGIFAVVRRARAMDARFNTRDFPEYGIRIIAPTDPSFDGIATQHFKNKLPDNLRPLSIFIKNSGPRTIVGYAISWELLNDGKRITSNSVGYSEPGILIGNEIPSNTVHTTSIDPGKARCFTWSSQIHAELVAAPKPDPVRDLLNAELSRATDVTVSLDAIVFDDGTFIGPNTTGFIDQMQALVTAKYDLMREVVKAKENGTVDAAFDSITKKSQEPDVVFGDKFSADEWYRYFTKMYAVEIAQLKAIQGKDQAVSSVVKSYGRAQHGLKKRDKD